MLRLALGKSGPFLLRPIQRRLEYKKEYELFKLRMTTIACVCAFSSLFIYSSRVTDSLFVFLLIYYYSSTILREHILIVNGSRIRTWWILHHYLSLVLSGVLLVILSTQILLVENRPLLISMDNKRYGRLRPVTSPFVPLSSGSPCTWVFSSTSNIGTKSNVSTFSLLYKKPSPWTP
jgi:hypothetical protein